MTDFAHDEAQVDRKRSKKQSSQQINDTVIRQIMSTMLGRHWMWLMLGTCHLFENIAFFDGEGAIQKTYFAAGERNIGLKLLADVQRLCPREYVLAMEENTKKELTNGGSTSTGGDSGDPDSSGDD